MEEEDEMEEEEEEEELESVRVSETEFNFLDFVKRCVQSRTLSCQAVACMHMWDVHTLLNIHVRPA